MDDQEMATNGAAKALRRYQLEVVARRLKAEARLKAHRDGPLQTARNALFSETQADRQLVYSVETFDRELGEIKEAMEQLGIDPNYNRYSLPEIP